MSKRKPYDEARREEAFIRRHFEHYHGDHGRQLGENILAYLKTTKPLSAKDREMFNRLWECAGPLRGKGHPRGHRDQGPERTAHRAAARRFLELRAKWLRENPEKARYVKGKPCLPKPKRGAENISEILLTRAMTETNATNREEVRKWVREEAREY